MDAAQCGCGAGHTCTAQNAHQQSAIPPTQLKATVRTQSLSMLMLKDMGPLSVHHSTPGEACKLCVWGLQVFS